jgi:hypothetical protein
VVIPGKNVPKLWFIPDDEEEEVTLLGTDAWDDAILVVAAGRGVDGVLLTTWGDGGPLLGVTRDGGGPSLLGVTRDGIFLSASLLDTLDESSLLIDESSLLMDVSSWSLVSPLFFFSARSKLANDFTW